jgi:hypothetical protein
MPLTVLTPDQLIRFAQVVYTALFKSYLLTMPGLLGSLCRIENWCEVSEVEALLKEREVRRDSTSGLETAISTRAFCSTEILGVDIPV